MIGVFYDTHTRDSAGGWACVRCRARGSITWLCVWAPLLVGAQHPCTSPAQAQEADDAVYFPSAAAEEAILEGMAVSPRERLDDAASGTPRDEPIEFPSESEILVDVRIEGNTTIPTSAIAKYVQTRPGRRASEQRIRDDIKSLWGTGWFFNVERRYRRTDEGLVLIFRVLERPIVGRVEYRGNEEIKTKRLAEETGLKPHESAFDVSVNLEAARRLEALYHEKGYTFATVELEKGGSPDDRDVIFKVNEGPKVRVTGIKIFGNEFVSDAVLKTKLRSKPAILWLIGGKYDPSTIPDDIAALEQYYRALGFFDIEVDYRVGFSEDRSRATIEYTIDEGPRFTIREIEFVGNRVLSDDELFADMQLASGDDFSARTLREDIESIRGKYGETGRMFASIDAVPRFLEEPGILDLVYQIDEDRVYYIRKVNVHFEGDAPYTKKTVVLNRLRIHPGMVANPRLIRLSERRLEGEQIFERGPLNGPRISVAPVVDDGGLLGNSDIRGQNADDEWNAGHSRTPQPLAPPRRTKHPAPRMPAGVPPPSDVPAPEAGGPTSAYRPMFFREPRLPQFDAAEPSAFHVKAAPQSRRRRETIIRGQTPQDPFLSPQNPLFESSPQGDPLDSPPGEIDVDVFVTEARTGRLMFGVGVNSDAGVVGSVILSEQNFDLFRPPRSFQDIIDGTAWRGGGQRFRMEAIPGNVVSRYLISWTDPYFLDTNYSLGLSGFFYNRFFEDWDEQRGGGRITVGRQLTPEWSLSGTFRIEEVVIEDPDVPTPLLLAESVGSNFLSSFRATLTHDTRDAAFLPGEGHIVEASFEQAFGDFTYPRAELEGSQFFTLYSRPDGGGRHVLMLRGQLGWTDSGTPIFERFYGGGFQSFRGFEFRGVSPRVNNTRIGGRWLALGTVEYVAPLTASEMIQGVVFTDFGTVEEDVEFGDFRATAGFGVRLTVPAMGPVPLAFDFAFPITKQDEDDEQVFSFYVGFTR